jgi:hypothetical protein
MLPIGKNPATRSDPTAHEQGLRQLVEPPLVDYYIVVCERHDLTGGIPNPRVQGVRLSGLLFEEISEAAGIAQHELGDYSRRVVARVVVHDQHFPLDGVADAAPRQALESPWQQSAPVIGADDDSDVHD